MPEISDVHRAFAEHLANIAGGDPPGSGGRAARAALRRGLGKEPGTAVEMFPYVEPFLSDDAPPQRVRRFYLVASLFAAHPVSWTSKERRRTDFGASMELVRRDPKRRDGVDRRFVALLSARADDLSYHLRQAVSLLAATKTPVDWAQLLEDLGHWDSRGRYVQRRWAHSMWATRLGAQPDPDTDEGSSDA